MPICEKCGYGGALFQEPGSNKVGCPKCFHVGKPVPTTAVCCPTCGQAVATVSPVGPGVPKVETDLKALEEEP